MALTRPRYSQIYDTDYKQSVRAATTADIGNLLATGNMTNTVDGVTLNAEDRILVKDQDNAEQNGIYRVLTVGTGSNGTWVRAKDANANDRVTAGMTTIVSEGDVNTSKTFRLATPDPIVIGTTELTFINPFAAGSVAGGNTQVQFNDGGSTGASSGFTFDKVGNVLSVGGNINVTGSILPSANVTYDLGSPTQRWREGWFSGSTIHIGSESLSVDNTGKWMFSSNGATVELGAQVDFNPPSANVSGNVTATNYLFANGTPLMTVVNTMIGAANTNMQGHVTEQISTANTNLKGYTDNLVSTANVNLKGYVDGEISTTTSAITTANTNMKGYVDGQISTTTSAITTANTNLKGYTDNLVSTANVNLKGYVDGQITNLVGGSPATLDTLNEIAQALGNDANLSVTLTNLISGVQGNVTAANAAIITANTNLKGYTDNLVSTANVNLKGYVDGQISTTTSAITTANTNMKGYVDAANTIQSNQISGANSAITTANTNMKGYVDGQISTTTSAITTANTNMKGYVDNGLSSLSSNKISDSASNVIVTASFVNVAINSSNVASFSSTGFTTTGNVSATNLTGTLLTAAQTNITSVGTLGSLVVGNSSGIRLRSVESGGVIYVQAGNGTGGSANTITFAPWTSTTSTMSIDLANRRVGIKKATPTVELDVDGVGAFTGNVSAGNLSATNLTGTLQTAAQPSITSVGTLSSLSVTNTVTAGTFSGAGTNLTGTAASLTVGAATNATNASNPTFSGDSVDKDNITTRTDSGFYQSSTGTTAEGWPINSGSWQHMIACTHANDANYYSFQLGADFYSNSFYMRSTNGSGSTAWSNVFHSTQSNLPAADNTYNLGGVSNRFATVYGVTFSGISNQAKYADLAENYTSDKKYVPGTVVVFGGDKEVTVSTVSHDPSVAGVVSTNPAYHMNVDTEGAAVALQGRVPCRVLGPVNKGDRVVSSDVRGVAERLDMTKYQPGCIIGKALGSIPDGEIATIEVVVGRN